MSAKLNTKAALSIASAAAVTMLFSQTCFATMATGKVTVYYLNSNLPNRGSCIQMSPAIPGADPYVCVEHQILFNETNDLFRDAYNLGKTCTVVFSTLDGAGHNIVDIAQCQ